jgi:hypothetical protein
MLKNASRMNLSPNTGMATESIVKSIGGPVMGLGEKD